MEDEVTDRKTLTPVTISVSEGTGLGSGPEMQPSSVTTFKLPSGAISSRFPSTALQRTKKYAKENNDNESRWSNTSLSVKKDMDESSCKASADAQKHEADAMNAAQHVSNEHLCANSGPKDIAFVEKQDINTSVKSPDIPYKEPSWGGKPNAQFSLEIIKGGCLLNTFDLTKKSYYVFGRLDHCDVKLDHPSSSRYHAILQYKATEDDSKGFYLYDLGSTHGTVVNKTEIKPKKYFRLRVGYVMKFGGSSRLYVLQGPESDKEKEIDTREVEKSSHDLPEYIDEDIKNSSSNDDQNTGIDWGMGEDAIEEEQDIEKLLQMRKPLELKDPKKTLRGFFEREGLDLEYEMDERGSGSNKEHVARVRLPIESASGEDVFAEGIALKKKDAVLQCALRACQILDVHDLLRNAEHESVRAKRAKLLEENDFYDSDDDNYLDRTGSVERKRKQRMARAGKPDDMMVESYETLIKKRDELDKKINACVEKIGIISAEMSNLEEEDTLDAYMNQMNNKLKKEEKLVITKELRKLQQEKVDIQRLIDFCKPTTLPAIIRHDVVTDHKEDTSVSQEQTNSQLSTLKTVSSPTKTEQSSNRHTDKHREKVDRKEIGEIAEGFGPVEHKKTVDKDKPQMNLMSVNPVPFATPENAVPRKQKKKAKKVYGAAVRPSTNDSKFSDWVPPEGQTGDGRTKLNEKFGY